MIVSDILRITSVFFWQGYVRSGHAGFDWVPGIVWHWENIIRGLLSVIIDFVRSYAVEAKT